jgi:E3 ubiquitin-protein ligase HECTD2
LIFSKGLFKEYLKWQKIDSESGFSFCQYPFLLDITSKREILEQDSEQQMISIAKKSYINRAKTRREAPRTGDLFLTIKVNRDNLVSDSMNEIEKKSAELKKKCRIEFINEAAIDMVTF